MSVKCFNRVSAYFTFFKHGRKRKSQFYFWCIAGGDFIVYGPDHRSGTLCLFHWDGNVYWPDPIIDLHDLFTSEMKTFVRKKNKWILPSS